MLDAGKKRLFAGVVFGMLAGITLMSCGQIPDAESSSKGQVEPGTFVVQPILNDKALVVLDTRTGAFVAYAGIEQYRLHRIPVQ